MSGDAGFDEQEHVVYRAYDSDGGLLYIGITSDFDTRLRGHRSQSPWFSAVSRWAQEGGYASAELAHAAEVSAIGAENPKWNHQHQVRAVVNLTNLSVKLPPDVAALLHRVAYQTGRSKQDLVADAIQHTYGSED